MASSSKIEITIRPPGQDADIRIRRFTPSLDKLTFVQLVMESMVSDVPDAQLVALSGHLLVLDNAPRARGLPRGNGLPHGQVEEGPAHE